MAMSIANIIQPMAMSIANIIQPITKDYHKSNKSISYSINQLEPSMHTSTETYVIDGRVVRAILKCKEAPFIIDTLVEPTIKEDFLKLIGIGTKVDPVEREDFDLRNEFRTTYDIVKTQMQDQAEIEPNILNTAHRFLQFMLANETKLNGIESVKAFKSAVFQVLDTYDSTLRSEIIDKFNALVEA